MESVILLNADWTVLGTIDWKKALKLVCKKKVEVLKYSTTIIRTAGKKAIEMLLPKVIRLIKMIRQIFRERVPFNRRNLKILYGDFCAYCGKKSDPVTVEHVIPRSKGGKSDYTNVVIACKKCNCKKDNRLPSEAGMYPKYKPHVPTISEFMNIMLKKSGINDIYEYVMTQ
jgi:5-methylcytosine-specific restriction endonuclease McrA